MAEADEEATTGSLFKRLAPEYEAAFARFLRRYYRVNVQQLHQRLCYASPSFSVLNKAADSSALVYSQHVCAQLLLDFNAQLGTLLFRHPEQLLPLFHCALLKEVSCNAGEPLEGGGLQSIPLKLRHKLKVRVANLPPVSDERHDLTLYKI